MSANFTPSLNVYTDLTPFRFWCQKVLPLAYDDSLSYYELLCKVVDYLNKTMEDVSLSIEDVEKLHAAYVSLQGYVNNYFNNLDVQEEINNKLDALVADGTIHEIFTPDVTAILNVARQASLDAIAAIPSEVTDWLDDNISQETGYVIDNTLTVSGAAADAKVTGDRLGELKSDVTQMENTLVIYDEQFLDNTRYEQNYYWYNSAENIIKTYDPNATAYYAYPKIVLPAGTYYINYVPNNFAFLKTVSSRTVVTLKSVTTNGSFTISEDTEFYLTVYDSTGETHPTVMLANVALPQSYIYGKYNYRFKYVTVDTLTFANGNNSIRTVGVGGDYDSISSACSDAVSGDIVLILPGIYTEQISIWGKKLHLIGLDKKLCTIIDHSGEYDTPPVEMNIGTLANLTIIEDGASPSADSDGLAYCVHNDNYLNTDGETLEIVNCDMVNDVHACIGFGMYANYTVKIRNCTMRSNAVKDSAYKRGALYFHANSGQNIAGQKFVVENCIVSSADTLAVYAGVPGGGTGDFTVRFSGNQIWSDTNGTSNDAASISESNTFILDSGSTGNSIAKLNNVTPRQGSKYSVTVNASSSAVINNKRNRIAQGGVFEFCAVSEDRSSYDTGIIKWDADGVLVIEQKNILCNVTFSTANGDLRVWNRDAVNNHTYSVSIKPF